MATTTSLTTTYAGEFAGKYIGAALLSGNTLAQEGVTVKTNIKYKEVVKIRDAVSVIYGELLKFDFRDSDMRRKFDSVKYDLKKLEDLVLDLKLKGKL